uniref:Protein E6 n=1 Tax=Human papillomavirus TaxID=10566 RepID=A0A385PIX5_9PAPI|nr:MAG: E6 protein [Human papillomavirus]
MWKIQQFLPHLMENLFPTGLREYCNYFEIEFFDLKLPCIFCRGICNLVDLAQFFEKRLCIVWRRNLAFACCEKCLLLCAKYESEHYCVCSIKAEHLHGLIRQPLQDVVLRCNYCFRLLTSSEKVDLVTADRYCWLVRGHWRAICSGCVTKEL